MITDRRDQAVYDIVCKIERLGVITAESLVREFGQEAYQKGYSLAKDAMRINDMEAADALFKALAILKKDATASTYERTLPPEGDAGSPEKR